MGSFRMGPLSTGSSSNRHPKSKNLLLTQTDTYTHAHTHTIPHGWEVGVNARGDRSNGLRLTSYVPLHAYIPHTHAQPNAHLPHTRTTARIHLSRPLHLQESRCQCTWPQKLQGRTSCGSTTTLGVGTGSTRTSSGCTRSRMKHSSTTSVRIYWVSVNREF